MREDFWQFAPTHKMILCTNHKPRIKGSDHAIWRRLRLIPFEVRFEGERQDKELGAKLAAEADGILAWLVRGCLSWQAKGLGEPEAVMRATEDYRTAEDVIAAFLSDCCVTGQRQFRVKASALFEAYSKWCESSGEHAITKRAFGDAMSERGFERIKNDAWFYVGIGLCDA